MTNNNCPFRPFVPVTKNDDVFVEIEILDDIVKLIKNGDLRDRYSCAIVGGRGMGKSSILMQLRESLLEELFFDDNKGTQYIFPFLVELPYLDQNNDSNINFFQCMKIINRQLRSDLSNIRSRKRLIGVVERSSAEYKIAIKMLSAKEKVIDFIGGVRNLLSVLSIEEVGQRRGYFTEVEIQKIRNNFVEGIYEIVRECEKIAKPNRIRVAIFLDAFHRVEYDEYIRKKIATIIFDLVSGSLDGNVSFVFSIPNDLSEILPLEIQGEGFANYVDSKPLSVFSEKESCQLIQHGVMEEHEEHISNIHTWVGGHPLITHLVMEDIWHNEVFTNVNIQKFEIVVERVRENEVDILELISQPLLENVIHGVFNQIVSSPKIHRKNLFAGKKYSEILSIRKALRKLKYWGLIVETQDQLLSVSGKYFGDLADLRDSNIDEMKKSIFAIWGEDKEGHATTIGAGFRVDIGENCYVVTCAHLVGRRKAGECISISHFSEPESQKTEAKIIKILLSNDRRDDICLVELPHKHLKKSKAPPFIRDKPDMKSLYKSFVFTIAHGITIPEIELEEEVKGGIFRANIPGVTNKASGSPIWRNGQVVGMIVAKMGGDEDLKQKALVIPMNIILNVIS